MDRYRQVRRHALELLRAASGQALNPELLFEATAALAAKARPEASAAEAKELIDFLRIGNWGWTIAPSEERLERAGRQGKLSYEVGLDPQGEYLNEILVVLKIALAPDRADDSVRDPFDREHLIFTWTYALSQQNRIGAFLVPVQAQALLR